MVKDLEEKTNDSKNPLKELQNNSNLGGGFEMSRCCDAPVYHTSGGIEIAYCSSCNKPYEPLVFGESSVEIKFG